MRLLIVWIWFRWWEITRIWSGVGMTGGVAVHFIMSVRLRFMWCRIKRCTIALGVGLVDPLLSFLWKSRKLISTKRQCVLQSVQESRCPLRTGCTLLLLMLPLQCSCVKCISALQRRSITYLCTPRKERVRART